MSDDFEFVLPNLDLGEVKDKLADYEVVIGLTLKPAKTNDLVDREVVISLGIKGQFPLIQTTTMDGIANAIQQLYNEAAERLNLNQNDDEDVENKEEKEDREEDEELF